MEKINNNCDLNLDKNNVTVFFVNDPICAYTWQFEPHFRKFRTLYKDKVNIITVLGGMVKNWEEFLKENDDFKSPKDITAAWESTREYGMPIDGSIWQSEEVTSYPPSLAVKLVGQISETSSLKILRMAKEELMVFNRNISKDKVLEDILYRQDRNGSKIVKDIKKEEALNLLQDDIELAKDLGVEVFPTVVITDCDGNGLRLAGVKTFIELEEALNEVAGATVEQNPLPKLQEMFDYSRNVFFKEIEVMYDIEESMVEDFIAKNLSENSYEIREVLGKKFIIRK